MKEDNWFQKLSAGIKIPMVVLMRLSSPVVEHGATRHGWCKPASLVQVACTCVCVLHKRPYLHAYMHTHANAHTHANVHI